MENQNNSVLEKNFRSLLGNFRSVIRQLKLYEKSGKSEIEKNVMNNCKGEIKKLVSNFNLISLLVKEMLRNNDSPSIPLELYEELKNVKNDNSSFFEQAKKDFSKNISSSNNFVLTKILSIFEPENLNEDKSNQQKDPATLKILVALLILLGYVSENDGNGYFYDLEVALVDYVTSEY